MNLTPTHYERTRKRLMPVKLISSESAFPSQMVEILRRKRTGWVPAAKLVPIAEAFAERAAKRKKG